MADKIDELRSLAQLLDDGKISDDEYDSLKSEVIEEDDSPPPLEEAVRAARAQSEEQTSVAVRSISDALEYVKARPVRYTISLGAGVLAMALGWRMWPLPLLAIILGTMALRLTTEREGRWMAWTGIGLGIAFALINLTAGSPPPVVPASANPAPINTTPPADPGDSLGVRFETLRADWNSTELPPFIDSEIRPSPESGELDAFLHRFDNSAVLAGAYDPDNGYVYALLARAGVHHESVSNMYIHLCSLLHPGSQECLNAYIDENNMFGKTMLDFVDVSHDIRWVFEGNEWRTTVFDNIVTVRVQAPGS